MVVLDSGGPGWVSVTTYLESVTDWCWWATKANQTSNNMFCVVFLKQSSKTSSGWFLTDYK